MWAWTRTSNAWALSGMHLMRSSARWYEMRAALVALAVALLATTYAAGAQSPTAPLAAQALTGHGGPVRAICLLHGVSSSVALRPVDGSVYDPVFSRDGASLYFISDKGYDFELYRYQISTGKTADFVDSYSEPRTFRIGFSYRR